MPPKRKPSTKNGKTVYLRTRRLSVSAGVWREGGGGAGAERLRSRRPADERPAGGGEVVGTSGEGGRVSDVSPVHPSIMAILSEKGCVPST